MSSTIKSSFVAGVFVESRGDEQILENLNPSDPRDVVDRFARADAQLTQAAVEAANAAAPAWAASNPQFRADVLDRIGSEILERREELARLLAREEGKVLREALGEVDRAGRSFKFYAQEALRASGEKYESVRPGVGIDTSRQPVGVVGIISPWNFPIAIPAWKIAPALCFGNCVVFKPAELVPSSAWALAEIISRSGLPAGVFNMLIGPGRSVGDALIRHPLVKAISFTGSEQTGRQIAAIAVERMAKVQLEMGGKNPLIVLDDADLDVALDVAIQGSFFSTGQRCTASSRLIVTEGIYPEFVARLVERTRALKVGDALDASTDIGPVADAKQLEVDLDFIQSGLAEGATLACGGERLVREGDGYFLEPALFLDVKPDMRIYREEIFGPVLSVLKVRNYEEAFAAAEDTPFGLSAGIVTTSLKYAEHFKRNSSAGMVMVNLPTAGVDYHVPFGGNRGSSYGPREQGTHAREFFTKVKTSYQLS
ncbi:TPA: aldehyde dehydrogenase family protein [Pseudomonas aeruginosa]|uniref:aldehyde dehydrogenase family protein n=1 Tax=Pseudomonas TaxID=286 RepID=UPI000CD48DF7|nr:MULTISPECIES: aldehyde dehydrogenase family protein [Pseudomonas]MBH9518246.1 aldehyde dehydrogenase family protein [Pseudomonas aeruginosa]MBI8577274.1 aldehyde dehydrogenase family protein [Pseudomonas aeruginosa]MBI8804351.1 aldehyde dehydrogenase family protein [Pseudomonas aeruginosa]MCU9210312.1 aldehyde dehydrogenase family protein [Pseudomonas aeruginosa]MDA3374389.1 aldehyde dehydrogenase family protein [Pseudomonas aeruginosa]